MLLKKEVKFLRNELLAAQKPIFFYDDDPDGLSSYLLFYHFCGKGRGILVNSTSCLSEEWARKVHEYGADKVFVLDVPEVTQGFVQSVRRPLFWIDHHTPLKLENVYYYNPRLKKKSAYIPTTALVYQIVEDKNLLWLAALGIISDYAEPVFLTEFIAKYPYLLGRRVPLGEMLYKETIGKLIRIFSFLLKGKTSDVRQNIRLLTKIKDPLDLLEKRTKEGKFLYKRFQMINLPYEQLLLQAKNYIMDDPLLIFIYSDQKWSFTSDLANELSYLYQDKIIFVARFKSGEYKCSLRSKSLPISKILEKSLESVEGRGGGHEFACGVIVKEKDWELFLECFREELKHV